MNEEQLKLAIVEQGNTVRRLKHEKAPSHLVRAAVDRLLELKRQLSSR